MRKNISDEQSEWIIVCAVAVVVIIALSIVANHQRNIWAEQQRNLDVQSHEVQSR